MKKYIAVLLLLVFCVVMSSCQNLVKLTEENGKLIDKANGITYVGAPICFEPAVLEEEPYAKCSGLKLTLYPIQGQDTSLWLSEVYEGIGGVWYAEESVTLPTLEEFDADTLYICMEETITVGIGKITEKADIDAVVKSFTAGESCAIVQSGEKYKLKFASEKYEGIYYNLLYVEGSDGENYIYDRSTQTCVNVGDVLLEYMPR
ncbi:MAG: hypothetical protein IJ493_10165 [Clostridia bacterium]|nr:hypothetical protein [Clostridia bacterium]